MLLHGMLEHTQGARNQATTSVVCFLRQDSQKACMCEPAVSFKKDISLPLRQDTPKTQEAQDAFLEGDDLYTEHFDFSSEFFA